MSVVSEFKEFIMRGSVLDLAIGIIIGIAFGQIITSLVNDVIMPPIGLLLGHINFSDLFINLSGTGYPTLAAAKAASAPVIAYGAFINTVINFIIIALIIFLMVRTINKMAKKEKKEAPPAGPTKEVLLLTEIRDLLKK
jgi:large conductance mechanosensitive channel